MAITPKLEIKQSQSLLMTPQLRQAISILQLNNLELSELIENEINANPLLEKESDKLQEISQETSEQTIDNINDSATNEEEFSTDIDIDNTFDDYASDREGYDIPPDYDWQDYAKKKNTQNAEEADFDYFEQRLSQEKSIYDIIKEQISLNFITNKERMLATVLTEFLDESGYFRGDLETIAQKLHTTPQILTPVLDKLKTFEPSGIFAQSLQECIKIQLRDKNRLDPMMEGLLDNLELLGNKDFKILKKKLNITDEDLLSMITDIKSTDPKPAAKYNQKKADYIIPDVFITKTKHGEYKVELNQSSLPRLLINKDYYHQIKTADSNKNTGKYLKSQLNNADFLVRALRQRAETILRVTQELLKAQYDFFEKGIEHLKPLSLKDIADAAEIHESTVSRVTTNKYVHTPLGIFELKYFFSGATVSYSGGEAASSTAIKHKIKNMIEAESADNILSDDKLSELLARAGFQVARRTVAKYRESLNIPTSSVRKREKRQLKHD